MTFGVSSSPCQRSFQPEKFLLRLSCTYELVGGVTVPFSSLCHWPGEYFMTVWCHLLGLSRPENNNASQTKDYQSPLLLRQLGIIFKLYSFSQNLRRLNLRTLNINLMSNLYQAVSTSLNSAGVVIQRLVQWECNWHFNVKTERSSTVRFP